MRIATIISLAFVALVVGCSGDNAGEQQTTVTEKASTPTRAHVANAIYAGIFDYAIKLQDGLFEGEPFVEGGASRPHVEWIDRLIVFGDLNGDGVDDAAALLVESSGGSGSNLYLSAVFVEGLKIRTQTAFIGNRVQIRSMAIANNTILMDLVESGPDDAMCCPTQMISKAWKPATDGLKLTESEITGVLSITGLNGTSWRLSDLNIDEAAPESPQATLTFEDGKLVGSAGCNNFFASVSDHGRGQIAVGDAGSTQMMCPDEAMELERAYLFRLQKSVKISFWLGKLSLTWRTNDEVGTLLFVEQ